MQLHCPQCGAQIHVDDVQLDRKLAKCRGCDTDFDFSKLVRLAVQQERPRAPLQRAPLPRAPVEMPRGIKVRVDAPPDIEPGYRDAPRRRGTLAIMRTWRTPSAWGTAMFCIVWNAFLVFWYSVTGNAPVIFRLFPLIHVTVGVFMTYRTLAALLNTTRITVSDEVLAIHHGPVPWPGNRRIAVSALDRIFAEEQIIHQKNGTSRVYHLSAVMKDGTTQRLVASVPEAQAALFLEQRIEEHLGISDAEVRGELRR